MLLLVVLAVDGVLVWRRARYRAETERLRAAMTVLERQRADAIVAAEQDQVGLMMELIRRQATGDERLHISVSAESSFVALDRGSARLRVMPARFGAETRVGTPPDTARVTTPRGARTVERVLDEGSAYPLPRWVWSDRGLGVPAEQSAPGWTGSHAIVTSGGTLIYSLPKSGPLADTAWVMPGAVRVSATDLAAIRANLTRGMSVYFF